MANTEMEIDSTGGSRPVPDPTVLTTAQLLRENFWLRELIESRLKENDKAIVLLQARADKSPSTDALDEKIKRLEEVNNEKFNRIDDQFLEKEKKTDKIADLNQKAINDALVAAKELVGQQNKSNSEAIYKSEAASTKQVDQQGILIANVNKGLEDKIADLKDRLTTIEGKSKGLGEGWGYLVGAVGLIAAIISIFLMVTNK